MLQRIISGVIMAAVSIAILLLGPIWRMLLVAALMLVSNHEMLGAIRSFGLSPRSWPSYAFVVAVFALSFLGRTDAYWPALVFVTLAIFGQRVLTKDMRVIDCFASLLPVLYPLSMYQFLLSASAHENAMSFCILFTGIGAACLSDTFALFGGLAFGKHKLAPDISPKKTWEGAISGFLGGLVAAAIVWWVQGFWHAQFPLPIYLISGALASVAGQIGDLAASGIKREAGIKDFGTIIPGHGGILDRMDSILFAVPVVSIVFEIYGI